MAIIAVGLNHRSASVDLLERLSIGRDDLPKALHHVTTYEHVHEAVVLSTCNRIEVYAAVSRFHGGVQDLRNFLAESRHIAPEEFVDDLYSYHDEGALRHLFRVAAGVDSMVVGESEILGQVRRAFQAAVDEGAAKSRLERVFRQALRVGKRARTETSIARNAASISTAAIDLAKRAFGRPSLEGKHVAILGAGKMGSLTVQALRNAGVRNVTVLNRSEERGRAVATRFDAAAATLGELEPTLSRTDILVSSTTASSIVLERDVIERVMAGRSGRPLLIIDIAVPRDVDARASAVEGVTLRDIDDLREVADAGREIRLQEVSKVEGIIAEELARLERWERSIELSPTVAALVRRFDEVRRNELQRMEPALEGMSEEHRSALDEATRKIVAKLLHEPVTRLKELGDVPGDYIVALRELFGLDEDAED